MRVQDLVALVLLGGRSEGGLVLNWRHKARRKLLKILKRNLCCNINAFRNYALIAADTLARNVASKRVQPPAAMCGGSLPANGCKSNVKCCIS